MRGVYYVDSTIPGLNSLRTLLYLTAPAAAVVEILSSKVTNATNTTNQQLQAAFQRITSLGSPTATSVTPAKSEPGDQAAGSTVAVNVTASEPTYTANTLIGEQGFASLAGWVFAPVPEERPIVTVSTSIGLRLLDTVPTAFDASVEFVFREIG